MQKTFALGFWIVAVSLLALPRLAGCGYTQVKRMEPKKVVRQPLPDLDLIRVGYTNSLERPSDAGPHLKTTFELQIANTGGGPFAGLMYIGFNDRHTPIQEGVYDHINGGNGCTLAPGDTIVIEANAFYPIAHPQMQVVLTILTDRPRSNLANAGYRPGADPIEEERYFNNKYIIEVGSELPERD